MAWGENASRQLGDATNTMSDVPVAVHGLTGVAAVAAGYDHSLALLHNGTVEAWGGNVPGSSAMRARAKATSLWPYRD